LPSVCPPSGGEMKLWRLRLLRCQFRQASSLRRGGSDVSGAGGSLCSGGGSVRRPDEYERLIAYLRWQ
jgi:hypothetical protein